MKKLIILFLLAGCLSACTSPEPISTEPNDMVGRTENNKFINRYFTVDAEDWRVDTDSLDSFQFLALRKDVDLTATILFGCQEKNFFDKMGFTSTQDIKREIVRDIKSKPEYEFVSDGKLKIDDLEFLTIKSLYRKIPEKTGQIHYYIGALQDHFLLIIFTSDIRRTSADAEKLIAAIKFN